MRGSIQLGYTTMSDGSTPLLTNSLRSTSDTVTTMCACFKQISSINCPMRGNLNGRPQALATQTSDPLYSKINGKRKYRDSSTPLKFANESLWYRKSGIRFDIHARNCEVAKR